MLPTVFSCYGQDRLAAWKEFRDTVETSDTPFELIADLWSRAPFVSPYLDYQNPASWPDPWHLVLDSRLDDLAIALGMLYTIKLTQRFKDSKCELYRVKSQMDKDYTFVIVVDNQNVLNLEYNCVVGVNKLVGYESNLVWTAPQLW